jgi:hypothetical protein
MKDYRDFFLHLVLKSSTAYLPYCRLRFGLSVEDEMILWTQL